MAAFHVIAQVVRWTVAEPLPQSRARRDFLQPAGQRGVLFAQTTRPQPVHKNARSIGDVRRVIDAFDPNCCGLFAHLSQHPNGTCEVRRAKVKIATLRIAVWDTQLGASSTSRSISVAWSVTGFSSPAVRPRLSRGFKKSTTPGCPRQRQIP